MKRFFKRFITFILVISFVFSLSIVSGFCDTVDIKGKACLVYLDTTNEILYEENKDEVLEMASMTKLVTCYLAIENLSLDDKVEYNDKEISVKDALYLCLLPSDNDAANALAIKVSGSLDEFTKLMNETVLEWGLHNTTFKNPSGLHLMNSSTCMDVVKIAKIAFSNETLRDIASHSTYEVNGKTIYSTNFFLDGGKDEVGDTEIEISPFEGVVCGKTGTGGDKVHMVVLLQYDGMDCYVVLMHSVKGRRYIDMQNLLNYAIDHITSYDAFKKDEEIGKAKIYAGKTNYVLGVASDDGRINLPDGLSCALVVPEIRYLEKINAPIKAGDKIGEIDINVAGEYVRTIDLLAKDNVEEGWFLSKYRITNVQTILIFSFILFVIILIILIAILKKRNKRKREELRKEKIREMARKKFELEKDQERRNWHTRV